MLFYINYGTSSSPIHYFSSQRVGGIGGGGGGVDNHQNSKENGTAH